MARHGIRFAASMLPSTECKTTHRIRERERERRAERHQETVPKFIVQATNVAFVARTRFSHKHAIDTNNLIYCLCRINLVAHNNANNLCACDLLDREYFVRARWRQTTWRRTESRRIWDDFQGDSCWFVCSLHLREFSWWIQEPHNVIFSLRISVWASKMVF